MTTSRTMNRASRIALALAGFGVSALVLAGCSASTDQALAPGTAGADQSLEFSADGSNDAAFTTADRTSAREQRDVITSGVVTMTVDDPPAVADEVIALVEGAGGRIDARTTSAPETDPDRDRQKPAKASVTARIPAPSVTAIVDQLEQLGTVESVELESRDVTAESIDLDSRINTLRTSIERLTRWLGESDDVGELIKLERTLQDRQAELENLTGQRARLTDKVAYSTVVISMATEPPVIEEEPEGPQDFWSALAVGWGNFVDAVGTGLVALGLALPWLVLLALLGVIAWILVRRLTRRQAPLPPAAGDAA